MRDSLGAGILPGGIELRAHLSGAFLVAAAAAFSLCAQRGGGRGADANGSSLRFTLGGQVVTDDGSPVPGRIAVLLSCGGQRSAVTYTNAAGSFGFPQISSSTPDCQVSANQPGYTSAIVSASASVAGGSPNVGKVVIHKIAAMEGVTTSATSAGAPKDAKKSFDRGLAASKKGKPEDGAKEFEAAVKAYPQYADAWYELGRARLEMKAADSAHEAFAKAMEIDPKLVGPQVELGLMAGQKHDWAESAKYLDRALQLDPEDYPAAWFADAVADYNLKKLDLAETGAREALKRDTQHANPRIEYVLGMILGDEGDYPAASAAFQDYLKHSPNAPDAERVKGMLASLATQPAK
jgi:tetratricopeptide (TPR) repeat protein